MSRKRITHNNVRSLEELTSELSLIARELEFHKFNPPEAPPIDTAALIRADIHSYIACKLGGMPKLTRQADGTLNMASRLDGFMSRGASRFGNTVQTAFTAEVFFVANDWPERNVPAPKHSARPALYIAKASLPRVGRTLFPSLGRPIMPLEIGLFCDLVEEAILGLYTEYYRYLIPRELVMALPEAETPTSLTPDQERAQTD